MTTLNKEMLLEEIEGIISMGKRYVGLMGEFGDDNETPELIEARANCQGYLEAYTDMLEGLRSGDYDSEVTA